MNINLVLGWIPLGISLYMRSLVRRSKKATYTPVLAVLFVLWLLFYPNAPYLVTDMVHVGAHLDLVLYDAILLSLFSLCGMILGWESLRHVHRIIEELFGQLAGWSVVFVVSILTSVGMYLGRYLRLNSWDVFTDPQRVIRAMIWQMGASARYGHFLSILFLFSLILLSGYVVYTWQGRVRPRKEV
jgi:uncharacterized membrane protein